MTAFHLLRNVTRTCPIPYLPCQFAISTTLNYGPLLELIKELSTDTNISQLVWAASAGYRRAKYCGRSHSKKADGQNLVFDLIVIWVFLHIALQSKEDCVAEIRTHR